MAERPEPFAPEWLKEPLTVDRTAVNQMLKDPKTAKGKYIRLFTTPGNTRSGAHIQDFIIDCTNLDEDEVDELTMEHIGEVFSQVLDMINTDAVDPTTAETPGNTTATEPTSAATSSPTESE